MLIFAYFIIISISISSVVVINSLTLSPATNNDLNVNTNNLNSYLDNLIQNSPIINQNDKMNLKNVIFKYSTFQEKESILNYISKYGTVVSQLQYLPFILAKIPASQYSILKNHNVQVYQNKIEQLIPKNILNEATITSDNTTYSAPINQINGATLQQTIDGTGINIAILDSGIDATHPDLKGKIVGNVSYVTLSNGYSSNESSDDLNGHGTHVAALAAGTGKASNGKYIGVAPGAGLYDVKVIDSSGSGTTFAILEGINYVLSVNDKASPTKRIDVISMSLGFSGSDPNDPISLALDIAVNDYGIVATVAAGNDGPGLATVGTPGAARSVITVGASYWENGSATFFSSRGPNSDYRYDPDLLAPGWQEISALAINGIIGLSEQYYSPNAIIKGSGGNYIPLSGTSMATPVTAGAVAILLQAFPGISPQSVRAALMATATNENQPEYVQGAGLINLQSAYNYLKNEVSSNNVKANVISLLPQRSIFPNDPTLYPGDELKVNLQFVAGDPSIIGIKIANSTIENLISYNKSENSLMAMQSGGYYGELLLTFTAPLNPIPGLYTGNIQVITNIKNYTLSMGPVYIKIPSKVIAWNLWYQADTLDTPTGNYAQLASYLNNNSIGIDVVNKPISQSWIYQYDTIIFPDNELSISNSGIALLKDYINNGGKVIFISSFYPFSEISNYNDLTKSYGISLTSSADIGIKDLGITQEAYPLNESMVLQNLQSVDLSTITNLTWYGGTPLQVSDNIVGDHVFGSLNNINSTPVMAGFTGNDTVKGQVFVFGSEYWFYNDYFDSPEQQFAKLFFNYVVNKSSPFIDIVNTNQEIKLGDTWNASVFMGTTDYANVSNAAITLTLPNSNTNITLTANVTKGSFGGLLSYIPTQDGQYRLSVSYENKLVQSSFLVYSSTVSFNVTGIPTGVNNNYPSFLNDMSIPFVDRGNSIKIGINLNRTLSNVVVSAVITLVPGLLQQYSGYIPTNNALFTEDIQLKPTKNTTYYEATIDTSSLENVGFYAIDVSFSQISNYQIIGDYQTLFFVADKNPSINVQNSEVNSKSFSSYNENSSSGQPPVMDLTPGQTITFSVKADSLTGNGTVIVLYIPLYPFLEDHVVINYWQINSTNNIDFSGKIKLPSATSILVQDRKLNFADNYYTAFVIILRDRNGNYDMFPIYTLMKSSILGQYNINEGEIFFVFVIIPGLIVLIYYLKSRGRKRRDYYNYNYNFQTNQQNVNPYGPPPMQQDQSFQQQEEINFCPYCGASLVSGSNFCMECGKKIK